MEMILACLLTGLIYVKRWTKLANLEYLRGLLESQQLIWQASCYSCVRNNMAKKNKYESQPNISFRLQLRLLTSVTSENHCQLTTLFTFMAALTWCILVGSTGCVKQKHKVTSYTLVFGMMIWLDTIEVITIQFKLFRKEFSKYWLVSTLTK